MTTASQAPALSESIMDIQGAADYLHIQKWTLYRLVKQGKVPGTKVGGQWRFHRDVLDQMFIQEEKVAVVETS